MSSTLSTEAEAEEAASNYGIATGDGIATDAEIKQPVIESPRITRRGEQAHPLSREAQEGSPNWFTIFFMSLFHVGAIAALFFFTWKALAIAAGLWFVSICLGIGVGYHRLLTHRGYKAPKALEYFLAICGTLALEGGPLYWVVNHRVHHQLADQHGDPHTPRDGGWWSHAGWVLRGKGLEGQTALFSKYAPDLMKDRFLMGLSKYHWVPIVVLAVALLAAGGWPWLLWGIFFRVTFGLHATWFVNSATHMWGSRRFATRDDSRNLWWVALLTGGEGWHNNHHAHPVSARHGLAWYEVDVNYYCIWIMEKLGLVRQVTVAKLTRLRG
ncbi:MAG TPA: fatty acid desaturase [Silvibacterium sp.]|jgi:stearoyl-CoA desaturase (delta-9 desaturase)|nr:fatty acid desaturase [Silvibacterium sp.]